MPASAYVWEPETTNAVPTPPGWLMVPADGDVPSPQSIMAVKSLIGAVGLASVNEATAPVKNGVPNAGIGKMADSVVLMVGWVTEAVRAASPIRAVEEIAVTEPPSSITSDGDRVLPNIGVGVSGRR